MPLSVEQMALLTIVLLPGAIFAIFSLGWLLGWEANEHAITRCTAATYILTTALALWLGWRIHEMGAPVIVYLGDWFRVHEYHFPLVLMADALAFPFLLLTSSLVGLIGKFSSTYMHRDPGFLRFYVLLNLFGCGACVIFAAGSFDFVIAGWELVGMTSVLLISFFQYRQEPVASALRVFGIYRASDIGLLSAVYYLHHGMGSTTFANGMPAMEHHTAAIAGLLILITAAGKSAQVPFSGWLPRAMEGPTPSSAIFYGAISVHAGAYLLLRSQPIILDSPAISAAVVAVGLLTAIHGTIAGRAAADAKTSLAYASLSQVGLIFAEIGFGFFWLPVLHTVGHAMVRTLQFLRAPSMLRDYHQVHAAAGGDLARTGRHLEALVPVGLQRWLYRFALDRGHLDTLLDRTFTAPLVYLSRLLTRLDLMASPRLDSTEPRLPFRLSIHSEEGKADA